jgi:hypothetical protein
MTFEEFFKKKRIDLAALEKAEPALFAEFKTHYEQMGEKSFDHTKKYWFNKTRRQFPLAPEIKTEKVHIENQLAQQTITDAVTEPAAPDAATAATPKMGFVPKFKAGNIAKPAVKNVEDKVEDKKEVLAVEQPSVLPAGEIPAAKPAYVPKFKMKPKVETEEATPATDEVKPEPPVETSAEPVTAKPAYKPRFNMKTLPTKPEGE